MNTISCYFCKDLILDMQDKIQISDMYFCRNTECYINGIPKYKVQFFRGFKEKEFFVLDKFYLELDYVKKITSISELNIIILFNTIKFNKIIDFDFNDIESVIKKITKIILLS